MPGSSSAASGNDHHLAQLCLLPPAGHSRTWPRRAAAPSQLLMSALCAPLNCAVTQQLGRLQPAGECCLPLDAHESSAHALRTFSTTCRGESAVRGAERARQHAGGVRAAHGRLLTSPAPTGVHSMAGFLRTRNSKT